ncbi:MAG: nucleotidyltransferase domain-containing protein [Thermomicrobiales bacterium]
MMRAKDVLEVLTCLDVAGIAVWLDGGWGVDALLGAQHRPHDDVDVVITLAQMSEARDALASLGFVMHVDEQPTRCVLRDPEDRRIDFHTVTFDAAGAATQRLPDGTDCLYPAEGFTGRGVVDHRVVRCLTAEVQLLHHLGYEPDADDRHDVRLLCARFGLPLPDGYTAREE